MEFQSNIIPKEINSEIKVTKYLSMRTLITCIIFILVTNQLNIFVHSSLQIIYMAYCIIVSVILVIPSFNNPGKKMYEAVLFSFRKDRNVYHPIESRDFYESKK